METKSSIFVKFPSIEKFANVAHSVQHSLQHGQRYTQNMEYHGRYKLHGANFGIILDGINNEIKVQKRSGLTDLSFYNNTEIITPAMEFLKSKIKEGEVITIFGEICGQGIQKKVAISQVKKFFAIFAIYTHKDDMFDTSQETINEYSNEDLRIYAIDEAEKDITFDFMNESGMRDILDGMVARVDEYGKSDSWAKGKFDVEGAGEGIVYYPVGKHSSEDFGRLSFKVKCDKFNVISHGVSKEVKIVTYKEVANLIDTFVTENRAEQIINENSIEKVPHNTGTFLKHFQMDVKKEAAVEIDAFLNIDDDADNKKSRKKSLDKALTDASKKLWMSQFDRPFDTLKERQ